MADARPLPAAPTPRKAITLLVIAALFAYYNSLHGAYVLDDTLIIKNPEIDRPFHGPLRTRPVVAVTVAVNYQLDGHNPRGYHFVNLVIHTLAAACLWDLVRRLLLRPRFGDSHAASAGWVALVVALVWLVHPLNTQSVTYVIQRCESLMGLFFLGTLWCYLRGATSDRPGWWYAAATACSALGAGCKEVMIALPPVLVLFDRAFLAGSWRGVLRRWRPLALVSAPPILAAAAFVALGFLTGREPTVGLAVSIFTPASYALTQTEVILHYLALSFWPGPLCLDYLDWPVATFPAVWPSLAGVAALLLVTAYGVARNRAWGFAAAAFFLILAPTSSLIPVQDAAFEHRMYLPLAALVGLVVVTGATAVLGCRDRWPVSAPLITRAAVVVTGIVVLALGLRTVVRNEDYGSPLTLYADNAKKRPQNSRVRAAYANMLFEMGKPEEAERELREALQAPRQLPGNLVVMAVMLFETGRTSQALDLCQRGLAQAPDDAMLVRQYGVLLLVTGRATEAVPLYRVLVEQFPEDVPLRINLGIALTLTGQPEEGRRVLRGVGDTRPEEVAKVEALARTIAMKSQAPADHVKLAVLYARAVCDAADPPSPEALDTLGITLARSGDFPGASEAVRRAIAEAERLGRDPYTVSLLRRREALYRQGKPFLPTSFAPSPPREVDP